MEKDQIILLKDRGLISISCEDSKNFLQNILQMMLIRLVILILYFQLFLHLKENIYLSFF